MAGNEIFNTVMRGYKKEEVAAYIASMSEQMQLLKNDLDRKDVEISRLMRDLEENKNAVCEPTEQQLSEYAAQIKGEVETELRAEYDKKLAEQAAAFEQKLSVQPDIAELEQKAREYDACKDALADLMIQARKNADEIISQAEERSAALKMKSEAEYAQLNADFMLLHNNLISIRSSMQMNLNQISDHFDDFEKKLSALRQAVENTIGTTDEANEIVE